MYCCKDRERCRDAMQEAFAALWERRKDVEFERCKRFLLTVTQHKIIDGIRRDSKNEPLGEEQEERQTTRPHDNLDLTSTIQTAMRQLSEQQRIILTLHDIEGYNYKEIAEMQEMNYSQVQVAAFQFTKKQFTIHDITIDGSNENHRKQHRAANLQTEGGDA